MSEENTYLQPDPVPSPEPAFSDQYHDAQTFDDDADYGLDNSGDLQDHDLQYNDEPEDYPDHDAYDPQLDYEPDYDADGDEEEDEEEEFHDSDPGPDELLGPVQQQTQIIGDDTAEIIQDQEQQAQGQSSTTVDPSAYSLPVQPTSSDPSAPVAPSGSMYPAPPEVHDPAMPPASSAPSASDPQLLPLPTSLVQPSSELLPQAPAAPTVSQAPSVPNQPPQFQSMQPTQPPLSSDPDLVPQAPAAATVPQAPSAPDPLPQPPTPAAITSSAPAADISIFTAIPQVAVTPTSPVQSTPETILPPAPAVIQQQVPQQLLVQAAPAVPQVLVVPSAAPPQPAFPPPPILAPTPPITSTYSFQPAQTSLQTFAAVAAPAAQMFAYTEAGDPDYTAQNVNTVFANAAAALGGPMPPSAPMSPPPPPLSPSALASPGAGPSRPRGSGRRTPLPTSRSRSPAQSPTRTTTTEAPARRQAPRPARGTPRTTGPEQARVPVPGAARRSPPRQTTALSSPTMVSPPPPTRTSVLLHHAPVITPIVEHPEYESRELALQQRVPSPVPSDTVEEQPPPPPPAYLKPVLSRPSSLRLANTSLDPSAPVPLYRQTSSATPAVSPQTMQFESAQHFSSQQQQQQPHILRREATIATSGPQPRVSRPTFERRGQSYDEQLAPYPQQTFQQIQHATDIRPNSIHTSVPVGAVVDSRTLQTQTHLHTGLTDVEMDQRGVHVNVARAEFARNGANTLRHQGMNIVGQTTEQGTDMYGGITTARSGVERIRGNNARLVSFAQGPVGNVSYVLNTPTLSPGVGAFAADRTVGHQQQGSLAMGNGNGMRSGNGSPQENGYVPGMTAEAHLSRASGLDTFIPYAGAVTAGPSDNSAKARLRPTLDNAKLALSKARVQAQATGWSLNVAIGLQVVLGALTTGIAAAVSGKTVSVVTSILGGISTLAASYLAKARGSGEPERSSTLAKELENYVRDCDSFVLDHGSKDGDEMMHHVEEYRRRFEILMGHNGDQVTDQVEEKKALAANGHVHGQVGARTTPGMRTQNGTATRGAEAV